MATATHSTTAKRAASRRSSAKKAASTRARSAIQLLKADHRAVEKLFGDFQKARGEARKMQLARKICLELRAHTQIEEEILYPTSREFLEDDEIVNEAIVEHQAAKDLIEQIEGMDASDEMFDAKVQVLQEQIQHHVAEEETEYFPQLQKTDMDLKGIGEQLAARKKTLLAELGDGTEMH